MRPGGKSVMREEAAMETAAPNPHATFSLVQTSAPLLSWHVWGRQKSEGLGQAQPERSEKKSMGPREDSESLV